MTNISPEVAIKRMLAVPREAFDGPAERWSYFTDNRPDAGLLGTLPPLAAAEASRPVAGTSIAAHVYHVAWGMDATSAWIRGDRTPRNWRESWRASAVDDAAWARLVDDLRREYGNLRQAIEKSVEHRPR